MMFAVKFLKTRVILLILALLAVGLLAGCTPRSASPAAQVTPEKQEAITQPTPEVPTDIPTPSVSPTATPTTAPTAEPSPTTPAQAPQGIQSPSLQTLWMFDEQTGWGTGMDGLFRTQDGGQSWQAVTPAEQQGSQYMPSAFFSSASAGWVLYPADLEGMTGVLYRTEDAGATWSQAPVEFPFAQLYFVDANSGWALNASDCGAGSCGGKLYRTHDGGITWETISYIEPDQPESAARIPFSGNKTGVTFADLNHGWVTGSIPMDGFVYLYETKDGGLTWQQQNLAVPPEYASGMMVTEPPRFFSPTDGILPAMVSGEQSVRIFFVTQDGGQTWTPMTPVSSGLFDFISLDQGWVWGEANLRMTVNRGQSWLEIPPNINLFTDLIQLDFVSPQAGWATTVDAEGKYTLYRTQDGGITWAP